MKRRSGNGRIWRRPQKGGAVYVADWTDADGRRRRKALSSDKGVAQRMLADIIRKRDLCAAGLGVEEGLDLLFSEVLVEFIADLRSRCTEQYAERVECVLNRVAREMGVRTIRDLQPQRFLIYRRTRLRSGIANRTANMELTVIRTLLNWAVRSGYIGLNTLQGVQQLPAGKGYEKSPRRALSEEEIERLISASRQIDADSASHALAARTIEQATKGRLYEARPRTATVPQTPLWLMLIETGARFGEVAQVTWGDVSDERRTLTLRARTTKSRRERTIPLRSEFQAVLGKLRLIHHEVRGRLPAAGDFVFLTPRGRPWFDNRRNALRRLQDVLKAAGIPRVDERGEKIDVHSLRHTFASRLARNNVGLVQAQKLLGHSDPKLTAAIYTHLDSEDLRAAVESLPPISVAEG